MGVGRAFPAISPFVQYLAHGQTPTPCPQRGCAGGCSPGTQRAGHAGRTQGHERRRHIVTRTVTQTYGDCSSGVCSGSQAPPGTLRLPAARGNSPPHTPHRPRTHVPRWAHTGALTPLHALGSGSHPHHRSCTPTPTPPGLSGATVGIWAVETLSPTSDSQALMCSEEGKPDRLQEETRVRHLGCRTALLGDQTAATDGGVGGVGATGGAGRPLVAPCWRY